MGPTVGMAILPRPAPPLLCPAQVFLPHKDDGAGMNLDFLDSLRPAHVAKGYNCKFFIP